MKKITVTLLLAATVFTTYSQVQRKWQGGQSTPLWDYATANWLDPTFPFPLPTTFSEGAQAIFDDSILQLDGDTISVSGSILVSDVKVNANKNYLIRRTADTDSIYGAGALVKDSAGVLTMDVKSTLLGGTVIKAGTVRMEKQTSPNIFGAKIIFQGGTANFATTSSSAYPSVAVPIEIPAGQVGKIELSRYSYWNSKITGEGDLHISVGGERTYLGLKNSAPDWSEFTGNVYVNKIEVPGVTPGYYGIMLNTNKTFKDSLDGFNIDSTFYNRKLILGPGASLNAESGDRAYAIGELSSVDSTSVIAGYYKNSTTPNIRYFVGGLNTDVVFKAKMGETGSNKGYNKAGIVKVGTGTYQFVNNNNNFIGGLVVRQGTVLIDDDLLKGNYRGGLSVGTSGTAIVEAAGTLGGKGRIQANLSVSGKLAPGSKGIGTLSVRDTLTAFVDAVDGTRDFNVTLQPGSVMEFEVKNAAEYDKLYVSGYLKMNLDTTQTLANPIIRVKAVEGAAINKLDRFEILTTDTINGEYSFEFPQITGVEWTSEIVPNADSSAYTLVVVAGAPTGINELKTAKTVMVSPNPVFDMANFTASQGNIQQIEIVNLQGQAIHSVGLNAKSHAMSLQHLNAGVYFARIRTTEGTEITKIQIR